MSSYVKPCALEFCELLTLIPCNNIDDVLHLDQIILICNENAQWLASQALLVLNDNRQHNIKKIFKVDIAESNRRPKLFYITFALTVIDWVVFSLNLDFPKQAKGLNWMLIFSSFQSVQMKQIKWVFHFVWVILMYDELFIHNSIRDETKRDNTT